MRSTSQLCQSLASMMICFFQSSTTSDIALRDWDHNWLSHRSTYTTELYFANQLRRRKTSGYTKRVENATQAKFLSNLIPHLRRLARVGESLALVSDALLVGIVDAFFSVYLLNACNCVMPSSPSICKLHVLLHPSLPVINTPVITWIHSHGKQPSFKP